MKIAVITHHTHDVIGGIEKYNRMLYSKFSGVHEITEYPLVEYNKSKVESLNERVTINKSLLGLKPNNMIWFGSYSKKKMSKIYKENDVVIIATIAPPRKWIKNKKTVLIQHMDARFYGYKLKSFSDKLGKFFGALFFGVDTFGNSLKKATRTVFFAEETAIEKDGHSSYIAIPTDKVGVDKKIVPKRFSSISRLDNHQKNIKEMMYFASKINNLDIYGDGKYKKKLMKSNVSNSYKGVLSQGQVLQSLLDSKALLITSNFEGFPNTISESLMSGTPVILYDTFSACKYFDKCDGVFLVKKNDSDSFIDQIVRIDNMDEDDYKEISIASKVFAEKQLIKEIFFEKWSKLFDKYHN